MKIKVLYKSSISTGYVGEENMSKEEYETRKSGGIFEFGLTSDVGTDYDKGRFYVANSAEDIDHNTEEIKSFIVLDFEVRKHTDGTWVYYSKEQFER